MEWSRHAQQGEAPTPRAGHAGVTIGENWYIVGGGDNKSGTFYTFPLEILITSLETFVEEKITSLLVQCE